jgi:N-acetylglucosaminyldiphosphoundecaprenol N-acetyl-beta-D-mannosaminyltransferase
MNKIFQIDPINLLGVSVHPIGSKNLNDMIGNIILRNEKHLILHVNAHCLNLTFKYPWLRQFLNRATIVFCDGFGVILGARILGSHIPERITYADWMWQLAQYAEQQGFSLFFLGARQSVAEKAATCLVEKYPGLRIAGVHNGHFDKTPGGPENTTVIQKINEARCNILIVGFGMPLQEKWLMENWKYIDANIALTGGAVFDYISGELRRSPQWMTNHGLEWLGRLIIEPSRLWKRYLLGNPVFLWRILRQRLCMGKY